MAHPSCRSAQGVAQQLAAELPQEGITPLGDGVGTQAGVPSNFVHPSFHTVVDCTIAGFFLLAADRVKGPSEKPKASIR